MEEKKRMMTMALNSPESPRNESCSGEPITTATCPTWKLYENPFYNPLHQPHHYHNSQRQNLTVHNCLHQKNDTSNIHHQCLHLPLSARKLAASFWDLTFLRPVMESELDVARAQIMELKTELEYERKARKKMESMNKRLAKEAAEERRGREAMEKMCEELAREISSDKAEISAMKREIAEERKMMRMSEVLREERVQMKLAEAKIVLEEKLLELECSKRIIAEGPSTSTSPSTTTCTTSVALKSKENAASRAVASFSGKFRQFVMGEKWVSNDENNNRVDSMESTRSGVSFDHDHNHIQYSSSACSEVDHSLDQSVSSENKLDNCNDKTAMPIFQRKAVLPETDNPHIKRGIKGFVEFPRVVRAVGSKSRQYWGAKLECQKAQLKILLKQKSPIRSNSLITS